MTSCDAGRVAQPLGDGLFLIDTEYVRPGLAASHLVVDQGRAAFIDTGPGPAAPRLLAALDIGVLRLLRVAIGTLQLGQLPKGQWRPLTAEEVAALGGD